MTPDDLRRYVKSHYRADNTVVVVVGSFDAQKALSLVEEAFRPLKARRKRRAAASGKDVFGAVVPSVTARKDVHQTQLALGFRTFGIGDRRRYAATVLDAILGRGMSSRLFQEVRERRGLSYDISSRMQFFHDAGMFTVTAGLDGAKAERALKTVERELKKVCERKGSAAELARIK